IGFDPIARQCRHSAEPFEWNGAPYAQKRDPRVLEVLDAAAQFRMCCGFVVPARGPGCYQAAASMAGADVELPPGSKPALHLMALYAFHRVRRLVGVAGPRKSALSPREREVLVWAAHGKSAWEIGEILHIIRRTVNEHTQSACRRLA